MGSDRRESGDRARSPAPPPRSASDATGPFSCDRCASRRAREHPRLRPQLGQQPERPKLALRRAARGRGSARRARARSSSRRRCGTSTSKTSQHRDRAGRRVTSETGQRRDRPVRPRATRSRECPGDTCSEASAADDDAAVRLRVRGGPKTPTEAAAGAPRRRRSARRGPFAMVFAALECECYSLALSCRSKTNAAIFHAAAGPGPRRASARDRP